MNREWRSFLQDRNARFEGETFLSFADARREAEAAANATVLAALSDHTLLRVHGADAQGFLNNQLSNDARRVDAVHSQFAAWCNAKGRMITLVRVFRRPGMDKCREGHDSMDGGGRAASGTAAEESESGRRGDDYYLLLPADLRETVRERLQRYILRAKVTLEGDDTLVTLGISGPRADSLLRGVMSDVPAAVDDCLTKDGVTLLRLPGAHPRCILIAPTAAARALWERLVPPAVPTGPQAWTWLDIAAGVPRIDAATSEQFVPQMANLELLSGVDFKKGCYPGQEIVARMHYLGRLKQRMYRAHAESAVAPGTPIFAPDLPGQSTGAVIASAVASAGGCDLLAVLQMSSAAAGVLHLGSATGPTLRLLPLPYALPTENGSNEKSTA